MCGTYKYTTGLITLRSHFTNFNSEINPEVYLNVPNIGKESRRFVSRLAKIFQVIFDVKVSAVYKTFKTGTYFQLKSRTSLFLRLKCLQIYLFV